MIQIKSIKNNLINVNHPYIDDNQRTYLTAAVSAAATALTVADNTGFTDDDWLVIGYCGADKTEIKKIDATVTAGTALTTTALTFDHPKGTQVAKILGNQIRIKRATTQDGTYSTIATLTIQADNNQTVYYDSAGTSTSWYKVTLYDSNTATEVYTSNAVQNAGYASNSLGYAITALL